MNRAQHHVLVLGLVVKYVTSDSPPDTASPRPLGLGQKL